MKAPFIGIMRHRLTTDGKGVTTLAAFHGCPLRCKYCLNPQSINAKGVWNTLSPEELLEQVAIDNLYFLATNGGITFGGGEPLLRADFIAEFKKICNPQWTINLETSLNVELEKLEKVSGFVDQYIVDIKDWSPDTYEKYTGKDNLNVVRNLRWLVEQQLQDKVVIRLPYIENYNTRNDVEKSASALSKMGFKEFDRFNYVVSLPSKKV